MTRRMGVPSVTSMDQRGSGTVLMLALVGAIVAVAVALSGALGLLVVRQRANGAADAAALAAADVASGAVPGAVCVVARDIAARNGAVLRECSVDGEVVTVSASVSWMGVAVLGRARAGPAPGSAQPKTVSV